MCIFSSQICYGGKVPDNFYKNNDESMFKADMLTTCTIANRDKLCLDYNVKQGQLLRFVYTSMFGV